MELISEMFGAFFAGAGAWAVVHYAIIRKPGRNGDTLTEYAARMIQDENRELKEKINIVEGYNSRHIKTIAELESKLKEMQLYTELMKALPIDFPFPVWMVNFRHEYDYISPMYEDLFLRQFGISAADAIGKNLHDVWPDIVAREFVRNNQQVIESGDIFNDVEQVSTALGNVVQWQIIKYKRTVPLGVIGVAIPKNGMFDKLLKKVREK